MRLNTQYFQGNRILFSEGCQIFIDGRSLAPYGSTVMAYGVQQQAPIQVAHVIQTTQPIQAATYAAPYADKDVAYSNTASYAPPPYANNPPVYGNAPPPYANAPAYAPSSVHEEVAPPSYGNNTYNHSVYGNPAYGAEISPLQGMAAPLQPPRTASVRIC
jgi:hypothetical protein